MSLKLVVHHLEKVSQWAETIPADVMAELEDRIGIAFPEDSFCDLIDGGFERAFNCGNSLRKWFARIPEEDFIDITGSPPPIEAAKEALLTLKATLPFYEENETGGLFAIPHDAPDRGKIRYHSLGDAVFSGGHKITVFDRPLVAEPVYNTVEALKVGSARLHELEPVGVVSQYRIAILDGKIHHPPLWPSEAARLSKIDDHIDIDDPFREDCPEADTDPSP